MKINNKLSNFEMNSKKLNIEKEISEYEAQKSEKIFELGLEVYDKIRRGLLDEDLFREICFDIKKLDLEIYNRKLDIYELEAQSGVVVCECGAILKKDDKFCNVCGKRVDSKKETILCSVCASKIDEDSNFCVCCGSKVQKFVEEEATDDFIKEDVEYEEDEPVLDETEAEIINETDDSIGDFVEEELINEEPIVEDMSVNLNDKEFEIQQKETIEELEIVEEDKEI